MDEITISVDVLEVVALPFTTSQISAPTGLAVTPVGAGGTFAANTYFWVVTATTALGETIASNEVSTPIVLNGSANLTWNLPNGLVSHIKVYRGTGAGAENALIATLGAVTSYTDTGTAGSAATPPVANTATVQDTLLITGAGEYRGYSMAETSGTAAAYFEIQDSSTTLAECRLSTSGSETKGPLPGGITINGRINMHVNSGAIRGTVWVAIPC